MEIGVKLQRENNNNNNNNNRSSETRRRRMSSPERGRAMHVVPSVKPFRRVQVVYYLTRNGQLEHPHYMEVSHLSNQHLRLKDVMDRLTILRGKGMPSLYSWSCKRSYKNGYVWNDLAENDIIHPAEGAEYVLKGSELIQGSTERFEQLQPSNIKHQIQEPSFHSKRHLPKPLLTPQPINPNHHNHHHTRHSSVPHEMHPSSRFDFEDPDNDEEEEEEENYTSSNTHTPLSRCSKGVSTEEIEEQQQTHHQKNPTELSITLDDHAHFSPPSTSSTDGSKRFEDGDSAAAEPSRAPSPVPGRNSMLFQLIACGSGSVVAAGKAKSKAVLGLKMKGEGAVLSCKGAAVAVVGAKKKSAAATAEAEEEDEISCMSMNPRLLGNVQGAEKEYFSGSIVESIMVDRAAVAAAADEPRLKKSSSYNEERSRGGVGLGEEEVEEEESPQQQKKEKKEKKKKEKKAVKAKCIPRGKKLSAASSKQSKEVKS